MRAAAGMASSIATFFMLQVQKLMYMVCRILFDSVDVTGPEGEARASGAARP
jgi:hypothetical protein